MSDEWEPIMCYADTATENDGTVTAYRYCGRVEYGHTQESAAAYAQQNAPDDIDDDAPATA